ncbi:MAG: C10 family peptidase [Bacteroidales bacterium]|nr:C10 family peptidase [Bacteroidales bacterium]
MSHISYLPKFAQRVVSLLIAYVLVCSSSFAAERSFETCHQIAREAIGTTTVTLLPQGDVSSLYYVFVGSDGGYAIVSSDDRTPALLGYDKKGTLQSTDDLPAPVLSLLANYSKRVENLAEGEKIKTLDDAKSSSMLKASRITGYSIGPLLGDIEWNQSAPYNNACPVVDGQHCVTGCVATAIAQVMKYYNYPSATIAKIPAYRSVSGVFVDQYEKGTPINWQDMRDSYKENYTSKEAEAVAQLCAMVGASCEMNYELEGSATQTDFAVNSAIKYFGYDPDTRCVNIYNYSLEEWCELLLDELLDERPILMSIPGHSVICDGIDDTGMFHFNWGWGGNHSGYYDITMCNTEEAFIGFKPDDGIDTYRPHSVMYVDWDGTKLGSEYVADNSRAVCPNDIPKREGYIFGGWKTQRESTVILDLELFGGYYWTTPFEGSYFHYEGSGNAEFEVVDFGANNTSCSLGYKYSDVENYAGIGVNISNDKIIDFEGSTGFSFYHMGSPVTVKVGTKCITDDSYHSIYVDSHDKFTKVTVKWEDLKGPGWGMGDEIDFMEEELYKEVTKFLFEVVSESGVFRIDEISIDGIDLLPKRPVSLNNITTDVIAIADYRPIGSTVSHTVTYADWDGTILGVEQVWEGENPVNFPKPPEREGYLFNIWEQPLRITEDVVITPQYKKYYTVTFLDTEGSIVNILQVTGGLSDTFWKYDTPEGAMYFALPSYASFHPLPEREGYLRTWDKPLGNLTEDITVSPVYKKYFNVTYVDWDGTVLGIEEVIEGDAATCGAYIYQYQKAFGIHKDRGDGYIFRGWDKPLTNIVESTVFTAQYGRPIVVTFYDWDGTKLGTKKVGEGGDATNLMTAPKRKGYIFVGWDNPLTNVTEEISVTAQYEVNTIYHTVTFIDQNGKILGTELVFDGEDAEADFPKQQGCSYFYLDGFMNITSDFVVHVTVTVYAVYYFVTYYDWDGTELGTEEVKENKDAVYVPNPKRDGYTFIGWDKSLKNITSDMSVTAQYEEKPLIFYTVTYMDWDGMELGTEQVEDSWDAVGLSPNPQRDGYTFVGWDKSLTNITSDMSVTAQYEEKPLIFYTVTYMDWDGKILGTEQVPEGGDAVGLAEIPQRAKYSFIGWSKPLTNITSKTTLIALYQPSTDIPSLDNVEELTKPQKVFKDGEIYILLPDGRKININGAEIQE